MGKKSKGFYKDYPNRKDRRASYPRNSARGVDPSCRPGGNCYVCLGNRNHSNELRRISADEQLAEVVKQ
jgi:hypothetical protein